MRWTKQEKRILAFLGEAYEAGGKRQRRPFSVDTVAANAGYSPAHKEEAVAYLVALEFVTDPDGSGQSQVTEKGEEVADPH
jgi:hypothetical protein